MFALAFLQLCFVYMAICANLYTVHLWICLCIPDLYTYCMYILYIYIFMWYICVYILVYTHIIRRCLCTHSHMCGFYVCVCRCIHCRYVHIYRYVDMQYTNNICVDFFLRIHVMYQYIFFSSRYMYIICILYISVYTSTCICTFKHMSIRVHTYTLSVDAFLYTYIYYMYICIFCICIHVCVLYTYLYVHIHNIQDLRCLCIRVHM